MTRAYRPETLILETTFKDYVYAKAMAWAGVDRFLKGAAQQGAAEPGLVGRLSE